MGAAEPTASCRSWLQFSTWKGWMLTASIWQMCEAGLYISFFLTCCHSCLAFSYRKFYWKKPQGYKALNPWLHFKVKSYKETQTKQTTPPNFIFACPVCSRPRRGTIGTYYFVKQSSNKLWQALLSLLLLSRCAISYANLKKQKMNTLSQRWQKAGAPAKPHLLG